MSVIVLLLKRCLESLREAVPSLFPSTGATHVELAETTFEYPPLWPGTAQLACPLYKSIIRLDHIERMSTSMSRHHVPTDQSR